MTDQARPPEPPPPPDDVPFDPYRYGKPDHPIPPEYWPPGYVPDEPPEPIQGPHPLYGPSPYATIPPPGSSPHPQAPYGQGSYPPPYGYPYAPPVADPRGKATAALWLGVGSIPLCIVGLFDIVAIVLAVVFGLQALNRIRRAGVAGQPAPEHARARRMAIIGLVGALVGTLLVVLVTVRTVKAINDCGGFEARSDTGFYSCVQDHLS
jgi:hypothetical protein